MKLIRAILVCSTMASPTLAGEPDVVIDHSKAEIGGKKAAGFWVAEGPSRSSLADPAGYTIHLVPSDDAEAELVYPSGEWFLPPPGRYRVFAQGSRNGLEKISPFLTLMSYHGGGFEGRGLAGVLPVVSGGRVVIPKLYLKRPDVSVRLLHLDSHIAEGRLKREMARIVTGDSVGDGVIMPSGPVFVALFDKSRDEYISLSRPVNVPSGGSVEVVPRPPDSNTSDVFAILIRGGVIGALADDDVEVRWIAGNSKKPPEQLVRTADRLYAIWYGLRGDGQLEIRTSTADSTVDVHLTPGKVARIPFSLGRVLSNGG